MIRCVLAATDGSEAALDAVKTAADLVASLGPQARLHVVSAVNYISVPGPLGRAPEGAPDLLAEQAQQALDDAQAAVKGVAAGLEAEYHLVAGDVVDAVLDCAKAIGADVLVAGYHGRSRLATLVMGSVVGRLVRSADLPVLIVLRWSTKFYC